VSRAYVIVWRDLLESSAWRALGINGRRLIDFLMIEHTRHAGQENGRLVAPRKQLEQNGIGARHISGAIDECVRLGLVDCRRGTGRRSNTYALTWLPDADGREPSNRWRNYVLATTRETVEMTSEGKSLRMTSEGKPLGYPKGSHKARSNFRREVIKPSKQGYPKGSTSIESSYHSGDDSKDVRGQGEVKRVRGRSGLNGRGPGVPVP
jgi:hypothetical protein